MQCAALTVHVPRATHPAACYLKSVIDRHARQPASAHDLLQQAPEVLMGGRCSEKVDIFSLGVVLWELVTGESPARGRLRPVKCTPVLALAQIPRQQLLLAAAPVPCLCSQLCMSFECRVSIYHTSVSSEAPTGPANCRTPEGQLPPTNPAKYQGPQFPLRVQGCRGSAGGPQSGMPDVATLALTFQ